MIFSRPNINMLRKAEHSQHVAHVFDGANTAPSTTSCGLTSTVANGSYKNHRFDPQFVPQNFQPANKLLRLHVFHQYMNKLVVSC